MKTTRLGTLAKNVYATVDADLDLRLPAAVSRKESAWLSLLGSVGWGQPASLKRVTILFLHPPCAPPLFESAATVCQACRSHYPSDMVKARRAIVCRLSPSLGNELDVARSPFVLPRPGGLGYLVFSVLLRTSMPFGLGLKALRVYPHISILIQLASLRLIVQNTPAWTPTTLCQRC